MDTPPVMPTAPSVKPLEARMVPFAVGGILVWATLGLVLLGFHGWVSAHGHTRWLWTCLAGVLWGLPGLYVMYRHDRAVAQRAETAQSRSKADLPYDRS